MADEAFGRTVPVIPLANSGIVRCRRCRTYMNPFCQWTDGGRRFKCNVCAMLNEAPVEYFSTLDVNGRRRDVEERPELSQGTVEWVAPGEYLVSGVGALPDKSGSLWGW
jgi:protein transport protein SEC24